MMEAFRMGYNCGVSIHPDIDALVGEVRIPRELSGQSCCVCPSVSVCCVCPSVSVSGLGCVSVRVRLLSQVLGTVESLTVK